MKAHPPAAQRGVFVILFAVLLVVILAVAGLAIDMGFAYERHGDMKNFANSAALAAAHQLDGSADGIDNAVDAAEDSMQDNMWGAAESASWSEQALTFSSSPDGPWIDADTLRGRSEAEIRLHRYARVDAALLDSSLGTLTRFFPYRGDPAAQLPSVVAVAGPVMTQMMPLAVCALSPTRIASRAVSGLTVTELVEHGFRRGVTYNLLQLNPGGTAPVNFVVNPVDFPDGGGSLDTGNFLHEKVAPFMCSGSITQPPSDQVYVQQPFPTSLIPELNTRFGAASSCVQTAALPDRSIRSFVTASWLNNNTGRTEAQADKRATVGGRLVTIADVDPSNPNDLDPSAPAQRSKEDYGTVWAYARPVRYSATAANGAGTSFRAADIDNLYPVDTGTALSTTLSDTAVALPYNSSFQTPAGNYLRYRRIMYVPLLSCPVTGNSATVLAIGKFLLSAPANDDPANPSIPAEFGGLLPGSTASSETRLFQ